MFRQNSGEGDRGRTNRRIKSLALYIPTRDSHASCVSISHIATFCCRSQKNNVVYAILAVSMLYCIEFDPFPIIVIIMIAQCVRCTLSALSVAICLYNRDVEDYSKTNVSSDSTWIECHRPKDITKWRRG